MAEIQLITRGLLFWEKKVRRLVKGKVEYLPAVSSVLPIVLKSTTADMVMSLFCTFQGFSSWLLFLTFRLLVLPLLSSFFSFLLSSFKSSLQWPSCVATLLEPIFFNWIILTRCFHSLCSSLRTLWTLFWCYKLGSAGAHFSPPLLNGLSFLISRGHLWSSTC